MIINNNSLSPSQTNEFQKELRWFISFTNKIKYVGHTCIMLLSESRSSWPCMFVFGNKI